MSQRRAELDIQGKQGIKEEAVNIRWECYVSGSRETYHLPKDPVRMTCKLSSDVSRVYLY
jgi:hypothetical protein